MLSRRGPYVIRAYMGGFSVGTGGPDPDGKSQGVSLEILVWTTLVKLIDLSGPIASRGRSGRPSMKYVDVY